MNKFFARAEWLFGVVIYLFYSTCLSSLLTGEQFQPAAVESFSYEVEPTSSPILFVFQWGMFAGVFAFSAMRWNKVSAALLKRRCIWIVVFLTIASTAWSIVPDSTSRRGLILMLTTVTGIYIATRFSVRQQMYLIGCALAIAVILSFGFTLAFPASGIEVGSHAGAWRGVMTHKNSLARLSVLCFSSFLLLSSRQFSYHRVWRCFAAAAFALIILSTSKTGLSLALLLMILIYVFRGFRWHYKIALPVFLIAFLTIGMLIMVFVGNQEAILMAMGRDMTLTGRTEIWSIVLEKIAARLWLGYGYRSFWLGPLGDSADVSAGTAWSVPNSHNGYLDLMLDLGVIGLAGFLCSFVMSFVRSLSWLRLHSGTEGMYPLICLAYVLLYNATESTLIFDPTSLFWFLYVTVSTSVLIQPTAIVSGSKRHLPQRV